MWGAKTRDFNAYFQDVIRELKSSLNESLVLEIQGVKRYIRLSSVTADALGKRIIKQIKHYTDFCSCPKCTLRGISYKRRLVFMCDARTMRTGIGLRRRQQPAYHTSIPPSAKLPTDMVKTFPCDYTHMLCLGTMKRLA